jgi:hypothetical protein
MNYKVKMTILSLLSFIFFLPKFELKAEDAKTAQQAIASLTDPAKLATLKGERAANPRLQKCVYWLAFAEELGKKPEAVLDESAKLNKTEGMAWLGWVDSGVDNLCITI